MSKIIGKLIKSRKSKTTIKATPSSSATDIQADDSNGYPVEYTSGRLEVEVDDQLLKRCKLLALGSSAYRLNDSIVLKIGKTSVPTEAVALRLVAEKTSIPVPRVIEAYTQDNGKSVILMEYIEGETLDVAWPKLDAIEKPSVIMQLLRYMKELRAVEGRAISSVDGTSCNGPFFSPDAEKYGPYLSEGDFNQGLISALETRGKSPWRHMVSRFIASLEGHKCVLTHCDLIPQNILIRDGAVVAILDWEHSGFYPDYWEYMKAYLKADWDSFWASERIPDQILEPDLQALSHMLHLKESMR